MISILTDSCADLTPDVIKKYKIGIIPLHVHLGEQSFDDGRNITPQDLFAYVEKTRQLPKTSAASVQEFVEFFNKYEDIIFIGIGSKLSATLQAACIAKESFPKKKIHLVDSNNLSAGIGLLVLRAADLRDQGKDFDSIVREIEHMVPKVRAAFIVDTLEYLYKGGRCSALTNIVGTLLKIRPVIEVRSDGTLGVREKVSGTRKKALDALVADFKRNLDSIVPERIFIVHTGVPQDVQYFQDEISKLMKIKEFVVSIAGATISSHCGPGTLGFMYELK